MNEALCRCTGGLRTCQSREGATYQVWAGRGGGDAVRYAAAGKLKLKVEGDVLGWGGVQEQVSKHGKTAPPRGLELDLQSGLDRLVARTAHGTALREGGRREEVTGRQTLSNPFSRILTVNSARGLI